MALRACSHNCSYDGLGPSPPNINLEDALQPQPLHLVLNQPGGLNAFLQRQQQFDHAQQALYTFCCICSSDRRRTPCATCRPNARLYSAQRDEREAYEARPDVEAARQRESDDTYRALTNAVLQQDMAAFRREQQDRESARTVARIRQGTYRVGEDDLFDAMIEEELGYKTSKPTKRQNESTAQFQVRYREWASNLSTLEKYKLDNEKFWEDHNSLMRTEERKVAAELKERFPGQHEQTRHLFAPGAEWKHLSLPSNIVRLENAFKDCRAAYDVSKPGTRLDNLSFDPAVDKFLVDWFWSGCQSDLRAGFTIGGRNKLAGRHVGENELLNIVNKKIEAARATGAIRDPMVNAYFQCLRRGLGDSIDFPGAQSSPLSYQAHSAPPPAQVLGLDAYRASPVRRQAYQDSPPQLLGLDAYRASPVRQQAYQDPYRDQTRGSEVVPPAAVKATQSSYNFVDRIIAEESGRKSQVRQILQTEGPRGLRARCRCGTTTSHEADCFVAVAAGMGDFRAWNL